MKRKLDSDRLMELVSKRIARVSELESKAKMDQESLGEMMWFGSRLELEQVAFWINLISTEELEDESNQVRAL